MCTVSMVGDHYNQLFRQNPIIHSWPNTVGPTQTTITEYVPRHEFEQLKRQVEEMKALLARAKEYDARNGEPDCEIEEKMDVLRRVAKLVGVDLDSVIRPSA